MPTTRDQAAQAIARYIDGFYNPVLRHSALDYISPAQFERWVIAPNRAIVERVRDRHPDTPIIGFPKGAGGKLARYAEATGVDAIGLDETVDPVWANDVLPKGLPVQGNLDPLVLIAGGEALERNAGAPQQKQCEPPPIRA